MKVIPKTLVCLALIVAAVAQESAKHEHRAGMNMPQAEATLPGDFASGTAWLPASSPQYMWMAHAKSWMFMFHGELFLEYDQQGGPRGVGKAVAPNWLMMMQRHSLKRGSIEFREMLSADALTIPHGGYPLLFQTGETYNGQPLVDKQHPHDVFGELSMLVTYPLSEKVSWLFYGGPVGEPALGPVAFLHRPSAMENPSAPLGHHQQDSTHISFGVVTTGFILGPVKVEGSTFNGREPDEARYNFDFGPMDSWSARISVAPSRNWVAQYSFGHLVQPEALEHGNTNRQTASVTYNRPFHRGYWANSLIWGRNHKQTAIPVENAYLYESTVNFAEKNYLFTRLELVDKSELDLAPPLNDRSFRIGAYTFGGVRDVVQNSRGQIGLGADVTFYSKPAALDPVYGNSPVSFQVFLRLRPGKMQH